MVSVYEPASELVCGLDEHSQIVEALRRRDFESAIGLSREHFFHVEKRLEISKPQAGKSDLATVFSNVNIPKSSLAN